MFATWITSQTVFNGVVAGLTTALVAMGIVLVFRSTQVINFAVGNMGLPAAALMAILSINYNLGFWLSLTISLLVGAAFAAVIELIVVRRLFDAPRVIVLVATIGVAQLALAIVQLFPDLESSRGVKYPVAIGGVWEDVFGIRMTGPQLTVVIVVPLIAVALGWFMNRTTLGRTVKASADNPDLARLSGISPKTVSLFVWTIAGLLSSISIIMLSGVAGSPTGVENLGASTLNRALAAAVIAGMYSFPRAVLAGLALGIGESLVRFNFVNEVGLIDMLLFVAVVIAVFLQQGSHKAETNTFSFAPRVRPIPDRIQRVWWVRNLPRLAAAIALLAAALLPLVITTASRQLLYTQIMVFAVAGLSLVVLTGWSGQISLGQMAFAGVGALFAASVNRGLTMDVWFISFDAPSIPWVLSLFVGAVFSALVAVVIGVGALRVRGLLLAVVTFSFAIAAQSYFYRRPFFSGGYSDSVPFTRGSFLGIDLTSERSYYWFVLAALAVAVALVAHLRRTGVGRTTIAVRDNAETAAAYTVPSARTKLVAFAFAGGLAGFAGAMLAGSAQVVPLTERFYQVADSLQLVAAVVIGGLGAVAGPVLGALWVKGLPAVFPDNDAIPLLTSSMGLLVLLLYLPGGLVQLGYSARDGIVQWMERRVPEDPVATMAAPPATLELHAREEPPETDAPVLATWDVSVQFSGIKALADVSIDVARDEIVGLIGTNGAGKSTLINAIGGYVPSVGRIELYGTDLGRRNASARARAGLGRTFQAAMLFPELTVRETVMVALEGRGRTGFLASALVLPSSLRGERAKVAEAEELIDFLGLGPYADAYISDLSTGTRRIVELAGLLALGSRVLCLDEPTAGIAQRETEAFGPLMIEIRRELGAAMVVIEHDMPLIMSISDRVYCLDLGEVIAEGTPDAVRNHPRVIASYLGTDTRAIERSDRTTAP